MQDREARLCRVGVTDYIIFSFLQSAADCRFK